MAHKKKKAPNNHPNQNKQKNRQQNNRQKRSSSTSEEGGTAEKDQKALSDSSVKQPILCEHYDKAINTTAFRKQINHLQTVECCKKSPKNPNPTLCIKQPELGNELFACTQCGVVVCLTEEDKEEDSSRVSHAHEHVATPRSDCHALFLQLKGQVLYCVPCGKRLCTDGAKVMGLISLIKKAKGCWALETREAFEKEPYSKSESARKEPKLQSKNDTTAVTAKKDSIGKELALKKEVRGFSNLGNTCFFNSVVQNIMQTTWLRQVLETISSSKSIHLESNSKLEIENMGDMTTALIQLYATYFNGSSGCIAPKVLFQSLCQFCPMFKSREQQDSQEMFSCLVNALFEEDEKRIKESILDKYAIKEGEKKVAPETRAAVKCEWKQAQLLNPVSAVFGGMLTKYIKCNHCSNINTKSEPFISLSLSLASSSSSDSSSGLTSSSTPTFVSPRRPNSNSFSRNENLTATLEVTASLEHSGKRRKAISENKPAPEGDFPINFRYKNGKGESEKRTAKPEYETEEDDDPDLIMGDLFDLEPSPVQSAVAKSETSPELFLPESLSSSTTTSQIEMHSSDVQLVCDLCVKVSEVDLVDIPEHESPKSNHCSDPNSTPDRGQKEGDVESDSDAGSRITKPYSASSDSAYASQTSLSVTGNNTLDSASLQDSVNTIGTVSPKRGHEGSLEQCDLSPAESVEDTTKIAGSESSGDFGLDDLFTPQPEDEANSDDSVAATSAVCVAAANMSSEQQELFSEDSNSTSMPDSFTDPVEALYMSTLSDGVYQPKENEVSIMSLMKSFTNLEYLTGCNKIKCDKCSVNDNRTLSDACVWYRMTSSPSVLVLHIKRFAQFGLRLRKLNSAVTIQPVLNVAPFCSPDCPIESKSSDKNRILYKLYGIVEHVGSLHAGHYTAYVCQRRSSETVPESTDVIANLLERLSPRQGERVKNLESEASGRPNMCGLNNVWYHISDSMVKQVPLSKVLASSPYMLFYEKIVSS